MFRVGLTGNIASGKSTVARIWAARGAPIVDADVLARRAVEPGSPGLRRVVEAFGPEVLAETGAMDRAAVRRIVFSDPAARERLEAIVHPEVGRLRDEAEARVREAGQRVVVHDIPLLYEVGIEDRFDAVVLVDAPEEVRLERLIRDRGLEESEARLMIEAQMPAEAKRARADYVIDNDGSLERLEKRADEVWRTLKRRAEESA